MREKIAFIVPTLSSGGAERVISNLSKAMTNDKETVMIIYHKTQHTYDHEGEVINLGINPSVEFSGKLINLIKKINKLKKIKKQYKFEKTISFLDNPNFVNVFSKNKNEEVYVSIRNHPSKEFTGMEGRLHKLLVRFVYSRAKKIIAISNGVKQDLIDNFGVNSNKIDVIYNPIDLNYVNDLKTEELDDHYNQIFKNPTIITVGRLSYQKGQWHLIRAFKKVVEKIPNAKLVILGKGELEDELIKLVEDYGLKESIHFLGFQNNPFKYIYRSKAFILPSLFEGFGNVIIEAMACEKPVISTDCQSGPREIIAPQTNFNDSTPKISVEEYGILIPVPDGMVRNSKDLITKEEELMSESIILILENSELSKELSDKGLERVKQFSFDNITNQWLSL